jgi:glycosyltransferase involved in cell wall biosynthesis
VLLVPLGPAQLSSSRVRVYQYLPYLAAQGVAARVVPFYPRLPAPLAPRARTRRRRLADRVYTIGRTVQLARLAVGCDLVLLQRVLLPAPLQRLLARHAGRLLFDVDDAIYTTHAGAEAGPAWLERQQRRFAQTVRASRAVLAATPWLVERARCHQPRSVEVASPVDCLRYQPRRRPAGSGQVIGWIGSPTTTIYLRPLLPLLRRLVARRVGLRVVLVGADPAIAGDGLEVRPWSYATELDELAGFDLGIMPLDDDEWARGKAGYKLLQYQACGLPAVASPVGHNLALIQPGQTGLLAQDEADWERALSRLLDDAALRQRLGQAGRATVERERSLQVWAPRFLAALQSTS